MNVVSVEKLFLIGQTLSDIRGYTQGEKPYERRVCFFFKDLFLLCFIGKVDIQRGETERKILRVMTHSPTERNGPILCQSEARSLFWVSHAGEGSPSCPRLLSQATGRELEGKQGYRD